MKKSFSKTEIPTWVLEKMKHYCAYQERSVADVKSKLQTFHLQDSVYEAIINYLIEEDFLNEERYAKMFASGKFRINQWGRNKIFIALQQKKIPELFIQEALNGIDDKDYVAALKRIIAKKNKELTDHDIFIRNKKLANFAISRGFEPNLIWDILDYRK